ncbi:hypothetical protein ACFQ88_21245 [Paenibacillus sp. NPDC056579]|uniref:hypothetical protein n=1 Tax=unclassified Paenibacillus TaxID=185978 RepID=UPI001EF8562B|nr:hypothetical protein [Paenibacillus sp. H1-7]ULL13932.1 hypothetical protein DVH26_05400 [Paenibacillus sp. H1-7]
MNTCKSLFHNEDPGDEAYLTLAIQTVLYNHREHLLQLPDSLSCEPYLQELSAEIVRRAHKFKQVAEAAARRIDMRVYDVKGAQMECITRLETKN